MAPSALAAPLRSRGAQDRPMDMTDGAEIQCAAFDGSYGRLSDSRWSFHYTDEPLARYLPDRRLKNALRALEGLEHLDITDQSVLVVCGGVGGEGTFRRKFGFREPNTRKELRAQSRVLRPRLSSHKQAGHG